MVRRAPLISFFAVAFGASLIALVVIGCRRCMPGPARWLR